MTTSTTPTSTTPTSTTPTSTTPTISDAVAIYLARQARASHPAGTFDKAGRWYPDAAEQRTCCQSIRTPSRAWPHSINKHCRSVEHIAALCNVNATDLRRAIRALRQANSN